MPNLTLTSESTVRPLALALLTLALIALCIVLAVPFLPALTWAVALAIIAWPVHRWVDRHVPGRGLPAAISATLVGITIIAVMAFVTYELTREAASVGDNHRGEQQSVHEAVAKVPAAAGTMEWMDRVGVNLDQEVRKFIEHSTGDTAALLSGSLAGLLQFAIAIFILYHLFRDPARLLNGVRRILPMNREESDRVFQGFADSVHANLHATLVTSVIDGVGGGLMFWLLGVPSPVMWGVVMFFLSFLPIVGTWLVWLPAAAYLALTGHVAGAVILIAWGVASLIVVDNFIYVRIAGDRMHLHQVPALLAFVGGLAVFGATGMILGPAMLAVTVAVLEVWHRRLGRETEPISTTQKVTAPASVELPPSSNLAWAGP